MSLNDSNYSAILNATTALATTSASSSTLLSLPVYTSLSTLSLRLTDIANVYVLPPICLVGIVTNLLCLVCILQPENRSNTVFHFMLVNTVTDFCFLSICVFIVIIRCGVYCNHGYAFFSKLYEQYIYLFVGNSFLLFGTLMDIMVSLNRLMSFSSKVSSKAATKFKNISWTHRCVILSILAMIINTPSYLVSRQVQPIGLLVTTFEFNDTMYNHTNETTVTVTILYSSVTNFIGTNPIGKTLLFVLTVLRGFALLVILFLINIAIRFKLAAHLKRKRKLVKVRSSGMSVITNEATVTPGLSTNKKPTTAAAGNRPQGNSSESNITAFVLVMCSVYLVGNLPNSISPILFTIGLNSVTYNTYVVFGNFMLFSSHGCYFFIYYIFNRDFRFTFNRIFCVGCCNPDVNRLS